MKAILQTLLIAVVPIVLASCSGTKKLAAGGRFMDQQVRIDGQDTEWPSPYPNYDEKAGISYVVANDPERLYVSVKTGDEMMQRKILIGGMTVWLDASSTKEQTVGIKYPLRRSGPPSEEAGARNQGRSSSDRPLMHDSSAARRHAMPLPNDLELRGFTSCDGLTTVHKANSCGILVRMDRNDYGELVWEAAIPLKSLGLDARSGQQVSVGIEIGALNMPARLLGEGHGAGGAGGGMHGGGMGGMGGGGFGGGGGGMHAGPGRGPEGDMNEKLTKSSMTWVRTALLAR